MYKYHSKSLITKLINLNGFCVALAFGAVSSNRMDLLLLLYVTISDAANTYPASEHTLKATTILLTN